MNVAYGKQGRVVDVAYVATSTPCPLREEEIGAPRRRRWPDVEVV